MVIHRTYLSAWGVNADQFPKSSDWLLINGYYGSWSGIAMLLLAIIQNFIWVAISAIALTLYIRLLLSSWNPFSITNETPGWLQRLPTWFKRCLSLIAISTGIVVLLFFVVALLFTLIGVPAKVGKAIGQEYVKSNSKDFAKRCEESKTICIEFRKGNEPIGTGYVLDISPTHLAYLDVVLNRARVIPSEGVELRSTRPLTLEVNTIK